MKFSTSVDIVFFLGLVVASALSCLPYVLRRLQSLSLPERYRWLDMRQGLVKSLVHTCIVMPCATVSTTALTQKLA